jgi:hypothetical protein
MNTTVSLLVEVPEVLHEALQSFVDSRPDWDQDRVFTASVSLFLLQNKAGDSAKENSYHREASRIYLDTLFDRPCAS